jgi:hypothetical protein
LAALAIPDEHKSALNKIRTMPEESLQPFVLGLERSPGTAPSAKGLAPDEAEQIKQVITELYRVRTYFDMGVSEFASAIAEALQEADSFPVAEVNRFKERLEKLLSIDSVSVAVKAQSLKQEYERRFCSARILTDARPVYGDDPSVPPSAAIIFHNLRISYHDDLSNLREIYIVMDGDDITTLRALLDRADMKAKSLESVFEAAKVKIVAP